MELEMPAGHNVHVEALVAFENLPAGHRLHTVADALGVPLQNGSTEERHCLQLQQDVGMIA